MRLALMPSGLTMDRVRSSAIRFDLSESAGEWEKFRRRKCRPPWVSRAVYLGCCARGNLAPRWKCSFDKEFLPGSRPVTRRCAASAPAGSDGEALPATAFAFDVRIFEAERLVQALFDEVHYRPIDQREAGGVDEHPHPPILEDRVSGLRPIGVVDDVRKAGAAGLTYPEPQTRTVSACRQEALDAIGRRFSK